ncbi:hypothetical protein [Mariniblastus fucicola]|uniref:Uncharacterized protein n=1 Tax=Mariniblastus fucicola TaxID=980251 RepID=A0A5B9P8X8_9BACT|nr:hypothetical protein [Mariniblastus fucicola]QEG21086.1 hypothetical protein MFFC18_09380 [Mariniblastus fucicola]
MAAPAMQYGVPVEGTVVTTESLPVDGAIVSGETILETGETVQSSPSDAGTVTSDVVEPPAAAESTDVAPEEDN